MNTLDSILPELRLLLPASLRDAYLDGYVQRQRTPMELLLSRSLPNVDVAASTFDDVRSEIRALGMHPTDEIPYLQEIEQALAVGRDTRPVVARAVAQQRREAPGRRNQLEEVSSAQPDETCHVCSETGKKSCTACGTELTYMGAHGEGCPRCAEQEMDVLDAQHASDSVSEEDVTERVASDIKYAARSSKLAAGVAAAKALTPAREAVLEKLDGRRLGFVSNAIIYDEGMRDLSKTEHKIALGLVLGGQLRVIKVLGALPGTHARSRIGADGPSYYVLRRAAQLKATRPEAPASATQESHDMGMAKRERYRQEVQAIGLPFDEENLLMTAVDRAFMFGHDVDAIIARAREAAFIPTAPSPDETPSRWMSGDHVIGPNGENGTIVRLEDRGEYGWHLKLDRPPGAHWQSAAGFRRVSEQSPEPPPVPPESPETPLHQQDRNSVDVLDRLVAALSQVFIVTPIRSGHGYRVVDLRSKSTDGVYRGLPVNTYLTTVSLWNSKKPEFLGEKAYLVQSFRDAGRSHQYRALRRSLVETVERLSDEAQGGDGSAAPPLTTRERYRREILSLGLPFARENEAMSALDRALINGHDPEEVMRWARRPEPVAEEQRPPPRPAPSQPADPAKIADRVRKLLALAERAGTPEEAGTAYAQAQKLIAQHAISEEQLRQSRLGASTRSNEPIVSRIIYTSPVPQMPTWIGVLGMCLSETNGCEMAQSHGPNREVVLKAWGRASDLEIVEELLRVIPGQVDALCNRSPFSGRTAKNNFRIGAVTVICERMRAAVREARRAIQEDTSEHSATTTALALASLDNRGALAKAQMRRDVPNLKMKSTRHRGDAASFEAGRAAGASIGLSRQRSIR